jgi:methyltransferase (TIGR00027 family)
MCDSLGGITKMVLMDFLTRVLHRRPAPSRTGQVVALTRAQLTRPHTPAGDPEAQRRLCRGMRPAGTGSLRASLIARTRFFDERVVAALSAGIRQVVILGAGYDDRALRFRSPGVRFFELDHPATQQDKRRRLRAMRGRDHGPVLAAADFRHDDVTAVLQACGHAADQPTLFLCEGLLVYLDRLACVRLLRAARAANSSPAWPRTGRARTRRGSPRSPTRGGPAPRNHG